MSQRVFLVVISIYTALYGLGLLLVPGECAAFFGVTMDSAGQLFGRGTGAAMIGMALTFWYARDAGSAAMTPVLKGVMYGGCTANVLGLIVTAWLAVTGVAGASAWIAVVIQAVIAFGFMYFAEFKRSASAM